MPYRYRAGYLSLLKNNKNNLEKDTILTGKFTSYRGFNFQAFDDMKNGDIRRLVAPLSSTLKRSMALNLMTTDLVDEKLKRNLLKDHNY